MKKIVILGGGESGTGSAVLAKRQGFDPFLSDNGLIKSEYRDILIKNEIRFEEGKHSEEIILLSPKWAPALTMRDLSYPWIYWRLSISNGSAIYGGDFFVRTARTNPVIHFR